MSTSTFERSGRQLTRAGASVHVQTPGPVADADAGPRGAFKLASPWGQISL